jgi:hypothetical protein
MTYVHITRTLIDNFDLNPPRWWLKEFHYNPKLGSSSNYHLNQPSQSNHDINKGVDENLIFSSSS